MNGMKMMSEGGIERISGNDTGGDARSGTPRDVDGPRDISAEVLGDRGRLSGATVTHDVPSDSRTTTDLPALAATDHRTDMALVQPAAGQPHDVLGNDRPASAEPADDPVAGVDGSGPAVDEPTTIAEALGGIATREQVEIAEPADPRTISTQSPDGVDDDVRTEVDRIVEFPSESADRRADRWHLQGDNELGYQGTCAIASSADMISDQIGDVVTEDDLVRHAVESGYCESDADTNDPLQQGGIGLDALRLLHEDCGLESERVSGWSQEQLAEAVEAGDGVIAAVKAAEYWPADSFAPGEQSLQRGIPGTDHGVWVTGVSRDDQNTVNGFFVNDTGLPDGARRFIGSDDFFRAWEARCGEAVVSRRAQ